MAPRSPVDVAYDRVRDIALRFPSADEKLSHGCPSFHVRGKMFLMFVGEAYGRGVAVWCKATLAEQRDRVDSDPARFFVPPYVGVKGWIGVDVDPGRADWIESLHPGRGCVALGGTSARPARRGGTPARQARADDARHDGREGRA